MTTLSLLILLAADPGAVCRFPTVDANEVPAAKVAALVAEFRRAGTDGLVILKGGKLLASFGEDKRLPLYSVTKAITGMAAGRLFTEQKWTNLETPLADLFPDLAQDPKANVTLRQLLSHTSGIADARDANGRVLKEWNKEPDWLAAARQRPMAEAPGTVFRYNNQGPVWIAAGIERATREPLARFVERTLFKPLCIEKYSWLQDKAGHTGAYTGLTLSAYDLAKLGQLMLARGKWNGAQLLSEGWVRQSALSAATPLNERMGLLWFLVPNPKYALPLAFFHSGDGGQYLAVFPNHDLVVARLTTGEKDANFNLLQTVVDALIRSAAPTNE